MDDKPEFLTPQEVHELTGLTHYRKQAEHLRLLGIPFWPNARGRPVVLRAALYGTQPAAKPQKSGWQPKVPKN